MVKSRKRFAVLLALLLMFSAMTQGVFAVSAANFGDTAGHWAQSEILKWSTKGILVGNDGIFRPNTGITRAEFCTIINRIFGLSEKSNARFSDVQSDKWYADQIAIATEAGYVSGYGNNLFGPEDRITRQDAAKILKAVFMLDGQSGQTVTSFIDSASIASYAKEAVTTLVSKGYIKGADNHFYPAKSLTRAEFAVILDRMIGQLYSEAGTYTSAPVANNVVVKTGDVVLKDMVIEGNLYLAEGIGQGNVTLKNVTVKGQTIAKGGGEDSIVLENTALSTLIIEKKDGKIRILAADGSSVSNVQLNSGAKLQESGSTGTGFGSVEVLQILPGQQLVLDGDFESVTVSTPGVAIQVTSGNVGTLNITGNASGANVQIAASATVGTLQANASAAIGGQGQINRAQINVGNVTIAQRPANVVIAPGVSASVGGATVTQPSTSNPSNPGNPTNPPEQSDWTLTWTDEFDGNAVNTTKWNLVNSGGGFGNQEAQYYSPDNASISNGNLVISARKETHPSATKETYTSAKLVSKFSQKYGKIEARIKLPIGTGLWPAFWMMPQDDKYGGWAASGEIDIMEARGRLPSEVTGTLHYGSAYPNNVHSGKDYALPEGQSINEFHTYSIEWEPGEIRWYVDGVLYQTQNIWYTTGADGAEKYAFPAPFDQAFFIQLNLAVGGTYDGMQLPPDTLFNAPVAMEVDYVRVYELTGRAYKTPVEPNIAAEPMPSGARHPDQTGNYVNDVNFEQGIKDNAEGLDAEFGEGWNFVHNAKFKGVATAAVDNISGTNYAKVNITNKGDYIYAIQLEQLTTLCKGRWYRYSFDAKADKSKTLITKLGGNESRSWAAYSGSYTANLTTEFQTFSYDFQMTRDSDILTRIEFNCATDTGAVWIGNVRVEEIDAPVTDYNAEKAPLLTDNYVYNGAFDKYTIDRMACWNVTKTNATATVTVPETTRELSVVIADGGNDAGAITVDQRGLKIVRGKDYTLAFKARAESPRTIKVKLTNQDGSVSYLSEQEFALSTEMQTFTANFSIETNTDPKGRLFFLLGGSDKDIYLDDVSLTATQADPYADIIGDGSFDEGLGEWDSWWGDEWSGVARGSMNVEYSNKVMKIHVDTIGGASYSPQVLRPNLTLENGKTYTVSFYAKATKARKMNLNIGKPLENDPWFINYMDTKVIDLTTELKKYTYEFTVTKPDCDTIKMVFELGNVTGGNASPVDVIIDNVSIKDSGGQEVVPDGSFDTGLGQWDSWWGDQWSGASTGNVTVVNDGVLAVDIESIGGASYSPQIFRPELTLEKGKTYELTFRAKASVARKVNVNIGNPLNNDPWFVPYAATQIIDLTNEMQNYSVVFTVDKDTCNTIKLVFEAGNVPGGNASPVVLYLDDVSIRQAREDQEPPQKLGHPLQNGTFDSDISGWSSYVADGSTAVPSWDSGKMKVAFTGFDGAFLWSTQIYQTDISLTGGKTYTLSFKAKASTSTARNLSVEVAENVAAPSFKFLGAQNVTLSDTEQTFSFDFTISGQDQLAKLIFMLGSGTDVGTQYVTIDDVTLVEKTEVPPPVDPDELATTWYLYNASVLDGHNMQVTTADAISGWQPVTVVTGDALYWYSPTLDGTYQSGDWSFVLWVDDQAAEAQIEVSVAVVEADGSSADVLGTDTQNIQGSGNHPVTFTFSGLDATTLDNQRIRVSIRKVNGDATVTMGYNPKDFPTRLMTPDIQ